MTQTIAMPFQEPRKFGRLFRNEECLERYKDHPLVLAATTQEAKLEMAAALDFQDRRRQERAEDIAAEALEQAKRSFFGKVFHTGVIFFFGVVPDAFDDAVDFVRDRLNRKP